MLPIRIWSGSVYEFLVLTYRIVFGMHREEADEFCGIEARIVADVEYNRCIIGIHRLDFEVGQHNVELEGIFEIISFFGGRAESI